MASKQPKKEYFYCINLYNNRKKNSHGNIVPRRAFLNLLKTIKDRKHIGYIYYYISKCYLQSDLFEDALEYIDRALDVDCNNIIFVRHRVQIIYKQHQYKIRNYTDVDGPTRFEYNYKDILVLYDKVYKLYMGTGIEWNWISPPSKKTFEERVRIHLSLFFKEYGHVLYLNEYYTKAEQMFKESLRIRPNLNTYWRYGRLLVKTRKFIQAKRYFELSMIHMKNVDKMSNRHRVNYINYCHLLITLTQYKDCLACLNKLQKAKPVKHYNVDKIIGSVYYLKGEVYWLLNKRRKAWKYIIKASKEEYLYKDYKLLVNDYIKNRELYDATEVKKAKTINIKLNEFETPGGCIGLFDDLDDIKDDDISTVNAELKYNTWISSNQVNLTKRGPFNIKLFESKSEGVYV